tara:strand:- start:1978 stop:2283 length:306 start_codon:yes stop_codon:yes gene_type:complete
VPQTTFFAAQAVLRTAHRQREATGLQTERLRTMSPHPFVTVTVLCRKIPQRPLSQSELLAAAGVGSCAGALASCPANAGTAKATKAIAKTKRYILLSLEVL